MAILYGYCCEYLGFYLHVLSPVDVVYTEHLTFTLGAYTRMYQYAEPTLPVKYPRTPGFRPSQEDNKYNAW